jgi:tungstate transport system ATP-binding protein
MTPGGPPPSASILPLALEGVGLFRDGKRMLKDITCGFRGRGPGTPGKTFIIGPNGAGKTLLLKVCHGLITPDEGRVVWSGEAAGNPDAIKSRQAMVFQRPVLLRRSARANIDFGLALRGVPRSERADRCQVLLKQTGLGRLAETPARALSFGEQQRLALARALAVEPEILYLDEPTASLDPASAHLVEDLVEQAVAGGTRIIMSSHDLGQAGRMADEVIFMHRGRIKEQADAATFFRGPENDLARDFLDGKLLWWRRRSIYGQEDPSCG